MRRVNVVTIGALVCGLVSPTGAAAVAPGLTAMAVEQIIAQAAGRARDLGLPVTVAVVDREGNPLGVYRMTGANQNTTIGAPNKPLDPDGLQGLQVPSAAAAVSKAGTAATLSSAGNAFSTRTLGAVVQESFPVGTSDFEGGPLFGVQFSRLPCSDVATGALPAGLSADPGGIPIYVNGVLAGGVGVEGDGRYSLDLNPNDDDQPFEEDIAVASARGFEAPPAIRARFEGMTLPYANTPAVAAPPADLPGTFLTPVRATPPTRYMAAAFGGVGGKYDPRFFPLVPGTGPSALSAREVEGILARALAQAGHTRSALRPPGAPTEVTVSVVGADGTVLGLASTMDAPEFGFDVSVQKARTAAFFSAPGAAAALRAAAPAYAVAAAADGLSLNGTIAFSSRAVGFLSRPFLAGAAGPFSKPINVFSPFNTGLQLALMQQPITLPRTNCTTIPALRNGIQPLAGGLPLYRGATLVGAIGVSGDGIDQDDYIAATGALGFEAPAALRADNFFVRGQRMPYVRLPRNPNL